MNATLRREDIREDGVFGVLLDEQGDFICYTLEHAYKNKKGKLGAKLKPGKYKCVREFSPKFDCDLFELKDVKGHSEIKFHTGNYNRDSDGCILVGLGLGNTSTGGKMLTSSKQALAKLFDIQNGLDEFILTVDGG